MKTCCDCQQTLPLSDFVAKASCKDGYEPRCRRCRSIRYNKSSPHLLCKKIYLTQVTNSVNRGHVLPAYTLPELEAWMIAQANFGTLYQAWVSAGYPKDLAPSIDRINDSLPYQLDNLQLMSWADNRAKGAKSKQECTLLVTHRPVIAYRKDGTVYKEYQSMAQAMREFGGKACSSFGISSVCNGVPIKDGRGKLYTPRTYKGFIWRWV